MLCFRRSECGGSDRFRAHGLFRDYVGLTTIACWVLILSLSVYTELLEPPYKFNRTTLSYEMAGLPIIDSPFLHGVSRLKMLIYS